MKWIIFLLAFGSLMQVGFSQHWHRAKVSGEGDFLQTVGSLGIPVEGKVSKGKSITCDFSEEQILKMQEAGLNVDIIMENIQQHYVDQNRTQSVPSFRNSQCGQLPDYEIPQHFSHGSMGGYLTLDELYAELDEMRSLYPSLVSARQNVDPATTAGGRSLYYVRISDQPDINESEPEVLFLSLTHAREPMGMQQLVFFMWYLIENYSTDPEIQYLIDHTEIYFIPCVNPDGYEYNRSTNPSGGGLWRKNRRNNGDGSYGIDLNRNYGFQWGYDNVGSSPNGTDETYRGTSAFSEAETQAVRNFVQGHEFLLIQDYHTYSNVLLFPWGYIDQHTSDSLLFRAYSKRMTSENGFAFGTANECIGYNANGGSFDWYYGDQISKEKIIAWGPEVGDPNDGFWPAEALIDDICQLYIAENLYMVRFAGKFADVTDESPNFISNPISNIPFRIQRLGLDSPATYTVSLTALSSNTNVINGPFIYNGMGLLESRQDTFLLDFYIGIQPGETLIYDLAVDNGEFIWHDTLYKYYGSPSVLLSQDGSSLTGWNTSGWGTTSSTFVSSPSSICDSPGGDYSNNTNSSVTSTQPISIPGNASMAWLTFYAKWDIENNYDFVVFEISPDNGNTWIPQCGNYTNIGTADQIYGEPLYDGLQENWVNEEINLSDYLGMSLLFRFRLVSDSYLSGEGFYFDDFSVNAVVLSGMSESDEHQYAVFPNPTSQFITLVGDDVLHALIYDVDGRQVMQIEQGCTKADVSFLKPGLYYVIFRTEENMFIRKFIKK